MDQQRFNQQHGRAGHIEQGDQRHQSTQPWAGDDSKPSNSGRGERGTPRGREEQDGFDRAGEPDLQPSFAGRGPKGYRRSDARIREDVSDALTDDAAIDASDITVQVQDCDVTLMGTVADREQKRRAADLAEQVAGVRDVMNRLRLSRPGPSTSDEPDTGPVSRLA